MACRLCGVVLPESDFTLRNTGGRRRECKTCTATLAREWFADRVAKNKRVRDGWLEGYKCSCCGAPKATRMWSRGNQVRIKFAGDNNASLVDVEWLVRVMADSIPVCLSCCETGEQAGIHLHGDTIAELDDPLLAGDITQVPDCELQPGSPEKIAELMRRVENNLSLFQEAGDGEGPKQGT